tara:strand:+ start:41896 stop:42228 length:333 start_codon:yes stop_codon:yes gene_type:complete
MIAYSYYKYNMNKPYNIIASPELCSFMDIPIISIVNEREVIQFLYNYCENHKLRIKDSHIWFRPNKKMKELFKFSEIDSILRFHEVIQEHLHKVIIYTNLFDKDKLVTNY